MNEITSLAEWNAMMVTPGKALVVWTAPWCAVCPSAVREAQKVTGATIYHVEMTQLLAVATEAGFTSVPVFEVYTNGKIKNRILSFCNAKMLQKAVDEA